MIARLLGLKRRKREQEPRAEEAAEAAAPVIVSEARKVPELWPSKPKIVFVGSAKGGVGKSFIASTLVYVAAAHLREPVYAVDLDLDNTTLSTRVPPHDAMYELLRRLVKDNVDYANVAGIILSGAASARVVLKFNVSVVGCGGGQIPVTIRLIPAFHRLKREEQFARLVALNVLEMRTGVEALFDFLRSKPGVAIVDGKQKSSTGINYDPIYRAAKEAADAIIIVTEPPYLTFSEVTAPYRDILDKVILVANKVDSRSLDKVALFLEDARRAGIPAFIVPRSEKEREIYDYRLETPARDLRTKIARFVGAIARYLRLVEECDTGCCDEYDKLLAELRG